MIIDLVIASAAVCLGFALGLCVVYRVEDFYPTLKKRRKNRRLQKLVVYGDTETHLLYIQKPLPDSPETLRERRRSLSQWLGSRATDDVDMAPNTLRALQGYPEAEDDVDT